MYPIDDVLNHCNADILETAFSAGFEPTEDIDFGNKLIEAIEFLIIKNLV
jgi:hypothetical protein